MNSPMLKNKQSLATFVALDCPVLLLFLAAVYTSFDLKRIITAFYAFIVTIIFGCVLRKVNEKKYQRHDRLKVQEYSNVTKTAIIYRMYSILPYLHTLVLPLFLASTWFCRECQLAEALLLGAVLCCIVSYFVFDTKALIVVAGVSMAFLSSWLNKAVDVRIIAFMIVQAVLYTELKVDLAKSLGFADSVIISQIVTSVLYCLAGGYTYQPRGELNPFVDIAVNMGYVLLVLLMVLMAEEITNYYPNNCIKRYLTNGVRCAVLMMAVVRFFHWGYTEAGYRGGVTPFRALFKLFFNIDALIIIGVWLLLCAMCFSLLVFKSPAPNSELTRRLTPKSPVITALRKVLHFLVVACAASAMYCKQQVLLGMVLYIIFVAVSAVELLRFYGFLCDRCDHYITKIYRTFGESPAHRSLIVSHVGLMLACGAPFWLEMVKSHQTDYVKAFMGMIMVAFADSLAAIVGVRCQKLEAHEKSVGGSAAFFFSAMVGMVLSFFLKTGGNLTLNHIIVAGAVTLSATLVEAGCPHTDNFITAMTACIVYTNVQKLIRL